MEYILPELHVVECAEDHHLYGTRPWKGRQSQCLVLSYMCLTLERVGLVIMNTYLKVNYAGFCHYKYQYFII